MSNDRHFMRLYMRRYRVNNPTLNLRVHLRKAYGLSLEEFRAMVRAQGGRCKVCRSRPPRGQRLHVDHDHRTNTVRGLLCGGCNIALGYAHERPDILRALADYLDGHQLDRRLDLRIA